MEPNADPVDDRSWWQRVLAPEADENALRMTKERLERMKARGYLAEVAGKYLGDSGISPGVVAATLQNFDPENPVHAGIAEELEGALVAAAQGHARGISPSERKALGGNEVMPDYLLGPGDQKVYEVLRDSNLINAVLGRKPVQDPRDLVAGKTYATDESGAPIPAYGGKDYQYTHQNPHPHATFTRRRPTHINQAVRDYEAAKADPTRHSNFWDSPYPQHRLLTPDATEGSLDRSGDTIAGQTLSEFSAWSDASRRASRRIDGGREGGFLDAAERWVKNIGPELGKSHQHEWAKTATGRASPIVPDRWSDGTPMDATDRETYIDMVKDSALKSKPPTIQQHGAAQGKTYSPAAAWGFDFLHEFMDPITPATAAIAAPLGAARHIAKGGSLLGALTVGAGTAAGAEVVAEGMEPLNYAIGAATFPWAAGRNAFTAPSLESLGEMGKPGYREQYKQNQAASDRSIESIRQARELLRSSQSSRP